MDKLYYAQNTGIYIMAIKARAALERFSLYWPAESSDRKRFIYHDFHGMSVAVVDAVGHRKLIPKPIDMKSQEFPRFALDNAVGVSEFAAKHITEGAMRRIVEANAHGCLMACEWSILWDEYSKKYRG